MTVLQLIGMTGGAVVLEAGTAVVSVVPLWVIVVSTRPDEGLLEAAVDSIEEGVVERIGEAGVGPLEASTGDEA